MDLSKNIREIRESLKIKQLEIAERLGVDPANYSRIEKKGNNINFELLQQIADVFKMSVVDIINYPNKVVSGADSERVKELEKEKEAWRNRAEGLEESLNEFRQIRKEIQEIKLTMENDYKKESELNSEMYDDLFICKFVADKLKEGLEIDEAYKFSLDAYCRLKAKQKEPQNLQKEEDLFREMQEEYLWAYQLDFQRYLITKIRIKYNPHVLRTEKTNE